MEVNSQLELSKNGRPLFKTNALSPRQAEVLTLISEGFRDKEIAAALGISLNTVGGYVVGLMLKLGARSRPHAVKLYFGRGK